MAKKSTDNMGQSQRISNASVVLTTGDERYLMLEAGDEARAAFAARNGDPAVFTFDGASATAAEILDELRSMGLMAASKVVIVENTELLLVEKKEEEDRAARLPERKGSATRTAREVMQEYVTAPETGTLLLLRTGAGKWSPGKFEDAVVKGGGVVIKCADLDPLQAAQYCAKFAKKHGTTLVNDAARLLIQSVGVRLSRLENEIEKLAVAAIGQGEATVTPELVAEMIGVTREDDQLYDIQGYLLRADPQAALAKTRQMIEVSRFAPVAIGIAALDLARKVEGAARGQAANDNRGELSARLKLWGSSGDAILEAGRRMGPQRAAALLAACVESDARCKSGRGDPEIVVESLVLRFCGALNAR